MKLTDLKCRHAKPQPKEYKISDGQGLHLLIAPNGSKYWRWRYSYGGKNKGLAFGVYPEVTLLEAREKAFEARRHLRDGKDPAQLRREQKINAIDKTQNTFEAATRAWMKHFAAKWSPKHAARIQYRLTTELFPKIGNMALSEITPLLLHNILDKIQDRGANEMAKRLQQLLNQIFAFAIATGKANRNPAAEIRILLRPYKRGHFRALDYKDLADYLRALQKNEVDLTLQTRLALQFMLLTFVRTNELTHARWREIDFERREWIIPAARMKMRRDHIVPLSRQAMSILEILRGRNIYNNRDDHEYDWVFPQPRSPRKPMSNMTMMVGLKKLDFQKKTTIHGFRAMAMTAIKERLNYAHDIINRQLAHAPSDQLGRAYDRAEFLDQRKTMMQDWADHLDQIIRLTT